ncbi:sensor histidine kinase [Nonomuraea sp. NPDC050556]|uniref:sensor histidine kinase n=1 Tax=Nonomuraea sp. NPDC050556 TaxID=3364369 RepID=UPI0037BC65C8
MSEDVWARSYPFWDAYFGIVLVVTIALVSADGEQPGHVRAVAITLLVLLSVAYALAGRRAVRGARTSRHGYWYGAAMLVLFIPAALMVPATAVALSALAPQAFMSFRPPLATSLVVTLFAGPAILFAVSADVSPVLVACVSVVILSSSALLGVFIDRLGAQNTERARLIAELERTRAELAEVSREAGVLAERERLAGDIHDTLAQGFTGITLLVQAAEAELGESRHLTLAVRTAQENLAETRALIAALAPPSLADASLEEALHRLAKNFETPAKVLVEGTARPLAPATELALLRVAQEGLANVRKHARASAAELALVYTPQSVRLTLTDDGCGFDPEAARDGFGLRGMRGRVTRAGGTLSVASEPGAGTALTVELPCSAS